MAKAIDKLRRLTAKRQPVEERLAAMNAERDDLIREAVLQDDETQQAVADAAGVTKARVAQLAPKRKPSKGS